jgi:UDP:flavonoid glycosyltransferase YjiC (YdhE family)
MRILFTSWAWPSHLQAQVPLAWAARSAGHDVLIAGPPGLRPDAAGTGLPFAPVGRDVDALPVFREIAATTGSGGGPRVLGLLRDLAEATIGDLVSLARRWRPDVIVSDPTALAGPVAAAAAGAVAVRHLFGTDLLAAAGQFLPPVLRPMARRYGLDDVDPFGAVTIDPCPAGLQVATGSPRWPIRLMPCFPGDAAVTPSQRRARIVITWGTTLARLDRGYLLAGTVARALAEVDADLQLVVTHEQQAMLGALPANARVCTGTRLESVLPGCSALIAHGGAGSLLTGLAHGLPQLLVPRLPDHSRHAARLADAGAAIVVPAAGATPDLLRAALVRLTTEPGFRDAARRLQAEAIAHPSPARVVADLEQLVARTPVPVAADHSSSRA